MKNDFMDELNKERISDIWVWCKVMNDRLAAVDSKLDLLINLAKAEGQFQPQTQEPQQTQSRLCSRSGGFHAFPWLRLLSLPVLQPLFFAFPLWCDNRLA